MPQALWTDDRRTAIVVLGAFGRTGWRAIATHQQAASRVEPPRGIAIAPNRPQQSITRNVANRDRNLDIWHVSERQMAGTD